MNFEASSGLGSGNIGLTFKPAPFCSTQKQVSFDMKKTKVHEFDPDDRRSLREQLMRGSLYNPPPLKPNNKTVAENSYWRDSMIDTLKHYKLSGYSTYNA